MTKAALAFLLLFYMGHAGAEIAKECRIGTGHGTKISIFREAKIYDTYLYLIKEEGRKKKYLFGSRERSRGSAVRIDCAGEKNRAMVLSGEFTANATQGFVFTLDKASGNIGQLYFAEKSRPGFLYLGERETLLAIETNAYGETGSKYVVYRRTAGETGEAQTEGADSLPPPAGFEVVDLASSRATQ